MRSGEARATGSGWRTSVRKPQGLNGIAVSLFWAVPKVPSW